MDARRLRPPSEFDPDRQASLHLHWSRFRSWKLTPDLMSTTRSVWFFVIALTVIRLSMLATTDLEFDEAHYWMWSERLAPAYFSKGPGIAFAMRASTAIFGANEFGVRFFSPLLAAGTSLLMFYFARPGLYLLLGVFGLCTIPPIVWNTQHAWITLTHLRSRGGIEQGFGLHPLEAISFLGQHFLAYSPFLFLALAWGVIASWRRVNQQFKVLFLMWFGLPVFVFYFLLSINKSAAPNWDALAFPGVCFLAIYFWWGRLERSLIFRLGAGVALLVGLVMRVIALDTDLLRTAGVELQRSDPSDRMRGWKSATRAVEKTRNDLEAKVGEKLFLIADARDRASEISFYLRDKRPEGPNHPPVYIPESQDMVNQFSFWPRYDEFVELKPGAPRPESEVYTEESGINLFVGRDAVFIRDGKKQRVPHNIKAGFQSTELVGTIQVSRYGKPLRTWQVFLCRNYRTLPL